MKFKIPVITLLMVMGYLGQCYIQRYGITWHCITYAYALTIFFVPYICIKDKYDEKKKIIMLMFEFTAIVTVICIALASNQGNITSMYGTVISALGLVLVLDKQDDNDFIRRDKYAPLILLLLAGVIHFGCVYEQEAVEPELRETRTIFTERVFVKEGPAKGIHLG